ncbi:hypothetical protein GCM10010218_46770 [Streptomyces mashuensis]|uniref:Uncharacterized protein n=1 Tax=Streptomyces mashuensis TaxID=33904 RepID=A0A919B666_9ACTN|nr:hypothetical protein GCM10010218_46770 [Streptomyces mashuensis]
MPAASAVRTRIRVRIRIRVRTWTGLFTTILLDRDRLGAPHPGRGCGAAATGRILFWTPDVVTVRDGPVHWGRARTGGQAGAWGRPSGRSHRS